MEIGSRKRLRSQENDGMQQRKFFINQKIVEKSDKNLMQKVYEKTLSMMYKSSKNHRKKSDNQENSVESQDMDDKLDTVEDKLETLHGCKFCLNEIDSTKANCSICANCNLYACAKCNTSCLYCSVCLCVNCVNLFGCCLIADDNNSVTPICEDCKKFI